MDMDMKIGVIPYSTDDTDLASYLVALGAEMPVFDRTNPQRVTCVFELTEQQIGAITQYHAHKALVMPQALADARKKLLRLIKNG